MTALDLLKEELKNARETFAGTVGDIKKAHLHKDPGGKALPLGATYAHLVFSEDVIVHGMLQNKPALFTTKWKDKTGASAPMPAMDENWSKNHEKWAKSVKLDLPSFKKYEQAVYKATDTYMASLKPKDLLKKVDLGSWGTFTIAHLIYAFIIGHTNNLAGEIAVLKGIQGAKGYPF